MYMNIDRCFMFHDNLSSSLYYGTIYATKKNGLLFALKKQVEISIYEKIEMLLYTSKRSKLTLRVNFKSLYC